MSDNARPDEGAVPGITTQRMERVVALILLIIGIVVGYESYKLGARWTSDGPGAGYFPFYIGLIITISSLGILVQSMFGKRRGAGLFADIVQLKRVASVLVPAAVYVLAVQFVGIYVGSAVYIALFMIVLGRYSPLKSVIAAMIVNAAFFMMFEVWFKVPLYKGALNPLGFLGY